MPRYLQDFLSDDDGREYDAIAVDRETNRTRSFGSNQSLSNAEAIIAMAVARRGVDKEFYVVVPAGTYKEGDEYKV